MHDVTLYAPLGPAGEGNGALQAPRCPSTTAALGTSLSGPAHVVANQLSPGIIPAALYHHRFPATCSPHNPPLLCHLPRSYVGHQVWDAAETGSSPPKLVMG